LDGTASSFRKEDFSMTPTAESLQANGRAGELMPTLAEFAAQMAAHIAHDRNWTLDQATRWVEHHLDEARKEYRKIGAPLGDTDEGFIAWLAPRHQPPTAYVWDSGEGIVTQRFAVGDRVIAIDEQATGAPVGTVGTVVQVFARLPEICDVQFDDYAGTRAVLTNGIAPAPASA
jgi:hypothetical protein